MRTSINWLAQSLGRLLRYIDISDLGFMTSLCPAVHIERSLRGIPFQSEVFLPVSYKGRPVGNKKIDLLVGERLVVELKSVETLAPLYSAQLICYLRLTGRQLGLLINFNVPLLKDGVKRVVLS